MKKQLFWVFGILHALMLGFILFFLLGLTSIGLDTRVVLSLLFPVFNLVMWYLIYTRK